MNEKYYEGLYIFRPSITEEEINDILQTLTQNIKIDKQYNLGKKKMAYEFMNETEGIYVHIYFKAYENEKVNEIEQNAKKDNRILKAVNLQIPLIDYDCYIKEYEEKMKRKN